jgi:hypothetical protein
VRVCGVCASARAHGASVACARAARALATCATTTEISLHGPHHVAQKSTSTGTGDCGAAGGAGRRVARARAWAGGHTR